MFTVIGIISYIQVGRSCMSFLKKQQHSSLI